METPTVPTGSEPMATPPPLTEPPTGTLVYEQDFIPEGRANRPGTAMTPTHITVHETGAPETDAAAQSRWVRSDHAAERKTSFHWVVDGQRAIQVLPHGEIGWHAGHDEGNTTSIGVQACVSADAETQAAIRTNLAEVLAKLVRENEDADFDASRIVQHHHWTGKDCPATIRADGYWETLLADVSGRLVVAS